MFSNPPDWFISSSVSFPVGPFFFYLSVSELYMSSFSPLPSPFFATPFNFDPDLHSLDNGLSCPDPSLTRQDDAEDADINVIVSRFLKTGLMPEGVSVPQFGDFRDVSDYKSALDLVRRSEAAFAQFPADVRSKYHNNVGVFLDAVYAGDVAGVQLPDNNKMAPSGPSEPGTGSFGTGGGSVQGPGETSPKGAVA